MHNAGYKELGIDNEFVFVGTNVKEADLETAIKGIRALQVLGVCVTLPHKTAVMKYLDAIDETAQHIGAVNTIFNKDGKLTGYNTDWLGVVTPLEKLTNLSGKSVALIGAGGAARSVIFGITKQGGKVTIFNRTVAKAKELAEEFSVNYATIDKLEMVMDMDIIFNATSVGMHPDTDASPLPKHFITNKHIVFDAIYSPYETKLLLDAKAQHATIIHGQAMLLYQGLEQFKLFTGNDAPEEAMKKALVIPSAVEESHTTKLI
jgi:shikimate dehydrogenase